MASLPRTRNAGKASVGAPEMSGTQAIAGMVEHIYREQLRRMVRSPDAGPATVRLLRAMLRTGRTAGYGTLRPQGNGRTWLTGNIRLGSEESLDECERPFRDVDEMNAGLMTRWRNAVAKNDTVVVAGNAGEAGGLRSALRDAWRGLPGRKVLLIGPDDIGPAGNVDASIWNAVRLCVTTMTEPPLAITHLPLETVPAGMVNAHAAPAATATGSGRQRRICISADDLGHEPVALEELARRARELVLAQGTARRLRYPDP